jgi:hypothetical protein
MIIPPSVRVKGIWAENLMEFFYYSVTEAGGDGAAVICCANPRETADFFVEWWKGKYLPKMKKAGYKKDEFFHKREETRGRRGELVVNFHDGDENFMFCDQIEYLPFGDICFIVDCDCLSCRNSFLVLKVEQ